MKFELKNQHCPKCSKRTLTVSQDNMPVNEFIVKCSNCNWCEIYNTNYFSPKVLNIMTEGNIKH